MGPMYQRRGCAGSLLSSQVVAPGIAVSVHEVLATVRVPSLVAWRRIVAALDEQTNPEQLDAELAAVELACADFPDRLRPAPGRWLRQLFGGSPEPRLRVTRAIDVALQGAEISGDRLAWSDAPELAQATIVRVFDEQLGDAGLARWLRSSSHPRITDLALAGGITDRGASQLAHDPRLEGLSSLALFRNAIGPEGLAELIESPRLRGNLHRLLLGRNRLGEPGARALAGATAIEGLELLDLDCNRLEGPAVAALVEAPLLRGVRTLNLSNNPIGAQGCAALAACPHLGGLETLFLHGAGLDDDAVARLLRAPWMPRLRNLALSDNLLSMATIEQLADRRDLGLTELDICHNRFAETEAEPVLQGAPQFAGLSRLCL
jgi:hypothetical protein